MAVGHENLVYLHDDEFASVYQLALDTGDVSTVFQIEQPPIAGDFEGIALTNNHIFLITSKGELFKTPRLPKMSDATVSAEVFDLGISGVCEIEGLHALNEHLYIACKTTYLKVDKHNLLLIEYSLATNSVTSEMRLDLEAIGLKKLSPSAIWLNEASIYLLAAKQRRIIELNRNGDLIRASKLDKRRHPQPEGLAIIGERFIIADEGGGDGGRVSIYQGFPGQ